MSIGYTDDVHYQNMAENLRRMGHIGEFTPAEMVQKMREIKFGAWTESVWSWKNFVWELIHKDTLHGLYYITNDLVVGQKYCITYKIKQQEKGNATIFRFIGGHDEGFEAYKWYLDGKEMPDKYSSSYDTTKGNKNIDDDHVAHEVKYYGTFMGGNTDNNFYIQPNRGVVTQVYYEIWDFSIEEIEEFPE